MLRLQANDVQTIDDTLAAPAVSIEQAVGWLRQAKRPSLNGCLAYLTGMKTSAEAALILKEFNPLRYQDLWRAYGGAMLLPDINGGLTEAETACIEELNEMFPTTGMLEERLQEREPGEPVYIEIENMGWPFSDEEWFDVESEMVDGFDPSLSVLVLAKCLDMGYNDLERLWQIGEHMGWPEGLAPKSAYQDGYLGDFDAAGFCKRLKRRKLGCFISVFEMVWRTTGCYFFDYDPYNDFMYEFSVEGVRALKDEWEKAPAILARYEEAKELARDNPEVLRKVVRCWDLSIVEPKPRQRKTEVVTARTLAEMWGFDIGEQPGEATVNALITDDAWGPIGAQIEPETETGEGE